VTEEQYVVRKQVDATVLRLRVKKTSPYLQFQLSSNIQFSTHKVLSVSRSTCVGKTVTLPKHSTTHVKDKGHVYTYICVCTSWLIYHCSITNQAKSYYYLDNTRVYKPIGLVVVVVVRLGCYFGVRRAIATSAAIARRSRYYDARNRVSERQTDTQTYTTPRARTKTHID